MGQVTYYMLYSNFFYTQKASAFAPQNNSYHVRDNTDTFFLCLL